jgi:uncharacterized membrane protein YdjX (TVP38/TMEM64 family)
MARTKHDETGEKGARVSKGVTYLKIAVFIAIIAGIPVTIFLRYPDFGRILTDRDALGAFLQANEGQNGILYVVIVLVTTVLGVPIGQVVNFTGGFIFGVPLAYLLSIGGTAAGTSIAFHIAKYFGKEFVTAVFKAKNVEKFVQMMSTEKAYVVTVFVYLIPGLPKDMFTYAAGLSNIRALPFVATAAAARSPAMLATLLFAGFIREGNVVGIVTVVAVVAAFLVFVLIKRKQVFSYLESLHKKFNH